MGAIEHLTISLPADMAGKVRDWVALGDFADVSDVVLEALLEFEADAAADDQRMADDWVRREVLPAMVLYDADPSRGLTAHEVREHLARARAQRESARR